MLKSGVATVLLLSVLFGYQYYDSIELNRYCSEKVIGHSYSQVNSYVLERQLYLHWELTENTDRTVVSNYASLFFEWIAL